MPDRHFIHALETHDSAVANLQMPIWVGAEPTYTDRFSETPEWLHEALGDDKRQRAEGMLAQLARISPGAAVLRSVGRQYHGESKPRWSLGIYARRDGQAIWNGPPDPALREPTEEAAAPDPVAFAAALAEQLPLHGLTAATLAAPMADRVVFRTDGSVPATDMETHPALARKTVHEERVRDSEVVDALAKTGNYLVVCGIQDGVLRTELPAVADVEQFQKLLDAIAQSAIACGASALLLEGYPPPVDETIAWMTITADPAVIEANMAPATSVSEMFQRLNELHTAATTQRLDSYRLQYNGMECDSGGGGQITFGGPTPETSPFIAVPSLLPSLVRYFNRHPAFSYLHAPNSVGPGSQSPRPDEGVLGALPELVLALELLQRTETPDCDTIWQSLAPFLADPSGNAHRAEINVEKLWNPGLGSRGKLGLVEFRALRMGPSPKFTAALAALLRSTVAMLIQRPNTDALMDWGPALHDRFSLPYHLAADLREVLSDLDSAGFGLADPIVQQLLDDRDRLITAHAIGDTRIELRRAVEFWPLIGDVATQESGGSRLIDASTSRIEVRLTAPDGEGDVGDWQLTVGDWAVPLFAPDAQADTVRLVGLRYRSFEPWRGLHPTLGKQDPLTFCLSHPREGRWQFTLHQWRPTGEAYPGLPEDVAEARVRRQERCVVEAIAAASEPKQPPPAAACGQFVVDLRWL